jgi:hypothetical protein
MGAVAKILATAASIVVGTIVGELVGKTPIGAIPVIGEIVQTFCSTLVTGIMTCTLLYFLDRSEIAKALAHLLDRLDLNASVDYYRQQADYFESYAAQLMKIDLEKFREETALFDSFACEIENVEDERVLNSRLKTIISKIGIQLPWGEDFDGFMSDKNAVMVFG